MRMGLANAGRLRVIWYNHPLSFVTSMHVTDIYDEICKEMAQVRVGDSPHAVQQPCISDTSHKSAAHPACFAGQAAQNAAT